MNEDFAFGRTPFYFLRHGQTDANRDGILQGQSESELTPKGRRTAEAAAWLFQKKGLASIYASPLKRTWATAHIVSVITGAKVHALSGLMERHWGAYQGGRKSARPPVEDPEGVEPVEAFTARILDALRSIRGPAPVLVVAHSGVFREFARHIGYAFEREISIESTQILLIEPPSAGRARWRLSEVTD